MTMKNNQNKNYELSMIRNHLTLDSFCNTIFDSQVTVKLVLFPQKGSFNCSYIKKNSWLRNYMTKKIYMFQNAV